MEIYCQMDERFRDEEENDSEFLVLDDHLYTCQVAPESRKQSKWRKCAYLVKGALFCVNKAGSAPLLRKY